MTDVARRAEPGRSSTGSAGDPAAVRLCGVGHAAGASAAPAGPHRIPGHAGGDALLTRQRPGDTCMTALRDEQRHPLARRIAHWVMALSILVMIGSGWRIYNASPIFPFTFPDWATLGGDVETSLARHGDPGVASAIAWHFAAMWLLVASYLLFVLWGVAVGAFPARLPAGRPEVDHARHASRRCGSGSSIAWANTTPCRRPRIWGVLARGRADDRLGHRDLEAGAELSAGGPVRWLPGCAPRSLPRHGRHRAVPRGACRADPAGAAHLARDGGGPRQRTTPRRHVGGRCDDACDGGRCCAAGCRWAH